MRIYGTQHFASTPQNFQTDCPNYQAHLTYQINFLHYIIYRAHVYVHARLNYIKSPESPKMY